MKSKLMESKTCYTLMHIVIILAALGSSEPFDRVDISPWVMIIGLGVLLIYHLLYHVRKLSYIPKFDLFIAFFHALFWIAVMPTVQRWSNITGLNLLIYAVYPFMAGAFFVCLLVLNLIVYIIKRVQARHMRT